MKEKVLLAVASAGVAVLLALALFVYEKAQTEQSVRRVIELGVVRLGD